jgi:integrase
MKERYWLSKRGRTFYSLDSVTRERRSLGTSNRQEAQKIIQAKNESHGRPALGFALAKAYIAAYDQTLAERTWQFVMEDYSSRGQPQTQELRRRKLKHKTFNHLRDKKLIETTSEDFMAVLRVKSVFLQGVLRNLQNLAVGMGWLPWPVLAPKLWPKLTHAPKRGITAEEHARVIAAEQCAERRLYYQLLWEVGASQTDAANLRAENVDWTTRTLTYQRRKTGSWARLSIGPTLEAILKALPPRGFLFPKLAALPDRWRSAEFWRRCKVVKIKGVSLHSYRYSWAERAKQAGYPERFAQEALGHNSKAVHRAYARGAIVQVPPLENYEKRNPPASPVAPVAGQTLPALS